MTPEQKAKSLQLTPLAHIPGCFPMEFYFYFIIKGAGNESEVPTDARVADFDPSHRSVRNRTGVRLKSFPSFPPSSPISNYF